MMVFIRALILVLVAVALEQCASAGGPDATASPSSPTSRVLGSSSCPRPTDREARPLYETLRGAFVERRVDEGGAHLIVLKPTEAAANQSVLVTLEVYDAVKDVERGKTITLFGYVSNAVSGAHPTYSCVEF